MAENKAAASASFNAIRPSPGSGRYGLIPSQYAIASALCSRVRLHCIEVLGQRINGYLQFISGAGALSGASGEAKERAVAAFYERLVVLERQLGQIQEELQLG